MFLVKIVLYILSIQTYNALECLQQGNFQFSLSKITLDEIVMILQHQTVDDRLLCGSNFVYDHFSRQLNITIRDDMFGFHSRIVFNIFMNIATDIHLANERKNLSETLLISQVGLFCYNQNYCELTLMFQLLQFLMSFEHEEFLETIYPTIDIGERRTSK